MFAVPLVSLRQGSSLRCGFLDGTHGLLNAVTTTFYVFMKYAKLWDMRRREAEGPADDAPGQDGEGAGEGDAKLRQS